MRKKDIPVWINLYSNEFILKVKDDRHPVMLYKKFKVPVVISTEDAGVLRSNMTEQCVLLAKVKCK
jgi:adenosine deaminase/adenosine deaminase CECR1